MNTLTQGNIVNGEVVSIKPFGAFIKLENGKTGLVHISELSHSYVEKVEDVLALGQQIKVKILSVEDDGKISLSIKATTPANEVKEKARNKPDFEDQLKKWMKSSEERLNALAAKQKKKR